jgi:hypothetical protein
VSHLRTVDVLDALILAEIDRCDRLGVEPGADHMRLVSERRRVAVERREESAA